MRKNEHFGDLNRSGAKVRSRLHAFKFICELLFSLEDTDCHQETFNSRGVVGEIGWAQAVQIATDHLVAPTIGYRIERYGLRKLLPEPLADYFAAMLRLNRIRNEQVMLEIMEVARIFNRVGLNPLLIKGGASLGSGLYGDTGLRILSDIDLVTDPKALADCLPVLVESGYTLHRDDHPFAHCIGSLTKSDHWSSIDLHRYPLAFPYRNLLTTEELIGQSVLTTVGDATLAIPCATHQVILNVVHAELGDKSYIYGHVPLRALYDLHCLSARYAETIDWGDVERRFTTNGYGLQLDYHLQAAALVTGGRFPRASRGLLSSRILMGRSMWLARHPGFHRVDNRLLRTAWQIQRLTSALCKSELRGRFFRNLADPLWRRKHIGFWWHGKRTI